MDKADEAILDAGLEFAHSRIDPSDGFPFNVAEPISHVILVCWAQGLIGNGGLAYFFEMEAPGAPPYSAFCDAYRDINANVSAECIEAGASKFPFEDVHLQCEQRRDAMYRATEDKSAPTTMFDELDREIFQDQVWEKLTRYIQKHREIFLH